MERGPPPPALADLIRGGHPPAELDRCVEAALERNVRHLVVLDLRGLSDATDFFVIGSGDSDTHTRAIAENVLRRMKESDLRPAGVEGEAAGQWVLMDFLDVIVHLFAPRVREFYQLERLWGDAPCFELSEAPQGELRDAPLEEPRGDSTG
ncbi:MAG: ribosome silencing factor [Gemmatimonadota bacterium]